MDSSIPSWSAHLRYRLFRFWSLGLLPLLQSWRLSRSHFYATLKEKIMILTVPSAEQRVGREKVRIGLKYLRRLTRYSRKPYPGPATLMLCAERRKRVPAQVWRDSCSASWTSATSQGIIPPIFASKPSIPRRVSMTVWRRLAIGCGNHSPHCCRCAKATNDGLSVV